MGLLSERRVGALIIIIIILAFLERGNRTL
jgi:hypothetical protein